MYRFKLWLKGVRSELLANRWPVGLVFNTQYITILQTLYSIKLPNINSLWCKNSNYVVHWKICKPYWQCNLSPVLLIFNTQLFFISHIKNQEINHPSVRSKGTTNYADIIILKNTPWLHFQRVIAKLHVITEWNLRMHSLQKRVKTISRMRCSIN